MQVHVDRKEWVSVSKRLCGARMTVLVMEVGRMVLSMVQRTSGISCLAKLQC